MAPRSFTRFAAFVACAASLSVLAVPSFAVALQNPADSFLSVSSSSVAGMLAQVESNPTVRRHYARYFRVPEASVANYLRHNLVRTRLRRAGRYTMYLVRPNGLIYPVMTTLPKGARVFTMQTQPAAFLTSGDGNPIKEFKKQVMIVVIKAPPTGEPSNATVKVLPSIETQTLVPVKVQETILPTIVDTPVYQPSSPLTAAEQSPEAASAPQGGR